MTAYSNNYGKYVESVQFLFPELNLEKKKFAKNVIRIQWRKTSVRKEFFNNYAKENGFDPLVPDNWYKVRYRALSLYNKNWRFVMLKHFERKLSNCLMDVYPNIGLQQSKFLQKQKKKRNKHKKNVFVENKLILSN